MNTVLTYRRSNLTGWIIQHELTLFFVLTFLLSWTSYGIVAIANIENSDTANLIILIGAFAPTVSALLLSAISNPEPRIMVPGRWLKQFLPLIILAAGIEAMDHIFWGHQVDSGLILGSAIIVLLSALLMTNLLANRTGVRPKLTGVTRSRSWAYVPVALGLWPMLVLAANTVARLFDLSVPDNPSLPGVSFPILLLESFLWAALFGGGLNEEAGWRGFALPRLQSRFSPLIASIAIGALWGLWHVPLHVIDVGLYGGNPWGALIRIMDIPRAILFTWLYNRTRGSLLIVILFHAAINTTSYFMSRSHYVVFALVLILAILFVVMDRMWQKHSTSSHTS